MAYMKTTPSLFYQTDVAFYLFPLAFRHDATVSILFGILTCVDIAAIEQCFYFAVSHHEAIHRTNAFHSLAHKFFALHAAAVIRETFDIWSQSLKVNQLSCSFLPHRDGRKRIDTGVSIATDNIELLLEVLNGVWNGIEIWHGKDRAIARCSCRHATCLDSLFIRKTRLTEVGMKIHESRNLYYVALNRHLWCKF